MNMTSSFDLVFVAAGDADASRLDAALLHGADCIGSVFVACGTRAVDPTLSTRVEAVGLRAMVLSGGSDTQAVNRAMLLSTRDIVLIGASLSPRAGAFRALLEAVAEENRIGLAVASTAADALPDDAVANWCATSSYPSATAMPVPDTEFVWVGRHVLHMIGTFDETFGEVREALADLALRAQRMAFITAKVSRALAHVVGDAIQASGLPNDPRLTTNHPYYFTQRTNAESDPALAMASRAAGAARDDLSVCLDVRYLPEDAINGTSVYALELSRALVANTAARLSFCVRSETQRRSLAELGLPTYVADGLPDDIQLLHRPAQVFDPSDLHLLLDAPVPYVITFQDLIGYRAASAFAGDGESHALYQQTSYTAIRSAQGIIAISDHNRDDLIREFQLDSADVSTVHHGVNVAAFARRDGEDPAETVRRHGVPARFFLYIGSDYAHKNPKLVLAAYALFRASWRDGTPPPSLVIVGHPSGTRDGVFPHLRARPMPGVLFIGAVTHEVLRALYHRAIAYLYLSAYEGFGLPILEAMAAETPVLCSRLTSLPEVAGDAAIYADDLSDTGIARQLRQLVEDPTIAREVTKRGKARAASFDWATTAKKTFAAYRRAVDHPSRMSLTDRRFLSKLRKSSS